MASGLRTSGFNGDVMRELAVQFLTLAEKQETAIPLMSGHRLMGTSLLLTGDIATSREHFDCAIALYDPLEHLTLPRDLAWTLACQPLRIGRGLCGCLAIPRLRSWTQITRSRKLVTSAKLLR